MTRSMLSGALLALVTLAPAPAVADDVCVCVTVRGVAINETTTGYRCQPTTQEVWPYDYTMGPDPVLTVRVRATLPVGAESTS